MGETKNISVGVPLDLIEAADAAIAAGEFASIEHIMLTALEGWSQEREAATRSLRALVLEGIASGFADDFDMDDIKRAGREALAERRA